MLNGGIPLRGEVSISGAKNAVVAILPATILAQDVCVIENIPNISDVYYMTKILEQLGARIKRLSKSTLEIDTKGVNSSKAAPFISTRLLSARRSMLSSPQSRRKG